MTTKQTQQAQQGAGTTTPLYAIIHEETYRLQFEQLVFEVANELACAFNLRGTGQRLHHLLDELLDEKDPKRNDAEVLLRLVIETLLQWQQQDKARLIGVLIQRIWQAQRARGLVA